MRPSRASCRRLSPPMLVPSSANATSAIFDGCNGSETANSKPKRCHPTSWSQIYAGTPLSALVTAKKRSPTRMRSNMPTCSATAIPGRSPKSCPEEQTSHGRQIGRPNRLWHGGQKTAWRRPHLCNPSQSFHDLRADDNFALFQVLLQPESQPFPPIRLEGIDHDLDNDNIVSFPFSII